MVFADNEAEFDRLLKDMRDTVNGLGYEQVLAVDMQNASDEAASRKQTVKDFHAKNIKKILNKIFMKGLHSYK